jgi:hypothetical protein
MKKKAHLRRKVRRKGRNNEKEQGEKIKA